MTRPLEQLFPERREIESGDAYADLRLVERAPPGRPYVLANMIVSVDGRATAGGTTDALSSRTDRRLLLDLRCQVDAVLVGTATIAKESYGPLVRSRERQAERLRRGLDASPLAVTASRSMRLPVESPLFQDTGARIVVLSNSGEESPRVPADMQVERLPGDELDLRAGLARLRERHNVRTLLVEGGPTLLSAILAADALDELFLSLSPKLAGGGEPGLLGSASPRRLRELELRSVLRSEDGFLFLRYELR